MSHHMSGSYGKSHDGCGKIVHRPCSSCISSVYEIDEDSIEFSLLTWTWRVIKSSQLSCYNLLEHLLWIFTYKNGNVVTV